MAAVHAGLISDEGRDRSHAISSQSILRNDQPIHQVTAHFTPAVVQHPVLEHAPATLVHQTSYLEHSPVVHTPVVHAAPLVHHVGPVVQHGPLVQHTPLVQHGPLVQHLAPVHAPLVQHVTPAVHAPVVQHVAPAVHAPLVQHVSPVAVSVGRSEQVEDHVSLHLVYR